MKVDFLSFVTGQMENGKEPGNVMDNHELELKSRIENTDFFSDYSFASERIARLLIRFEKENASNSIWKATDGQLEELRRLCVQLETESSSVVGKLPKEFLSKYFLKFSEEEFDVLFGLVREFTEVNESDSYLDFTEDQLSKLKDKIREIVSANAFKHLSEKTQKKNVDEISEEVRDKLKLFDEINVIMEEIEESEKFLAQKRERLRERFAELNRFAEGGSFEEFSDVQSSQILALRSENQRLSKLLEAVKSSETATPEWRVGPTYVRRYT